MTRFRKQGILPNILQTSAEKARHLIHALEQIDLAVCVAHEPGEMMSVVPNVVEADHAPSVCSEQVFCWAPSRPSLTNGKGLQMESPSESNV